ncbi:MAG: peptidoglycan editing factor PgeF [Pseudomonadota bacterium]|nr:peptidoglycan editing factor PgeF [Pseudomonadota bacterium]
MVGPIRAHWPALPAGVSAFYTLRTGGVSHAPYDDGSGVGGGLNLGDHVGDEPAAVADNRARLRAFLPAEPVWLAQVHGVEVVDAAHAVGVPMADASVTSKSRVVCTVLSADCLPVLFCDTERRAVAAAHAGWRGLAADVLQQTVAAMRDRGARDIIAWLGPAIGPQRFEVGEEVRSAFIARSALCATAFVPIAARPGKYLADLYALARLALHQVGVHQIAGGGDCTATDATRFFSFRRDGVTGRMASMIWLD